MATHSDIELTEEEIKQAIEHAKVKKIEALKSAENEKYAKYVLDEIRRPWDHKDLEKYVLNRAQDLGISFNLDSQNEHLFKALCHYFTDSVAFESFTPEGRAQWSLKKGLLFCGSVGTGKTTLMRVFNLNKRRAFTIISCKKIAAQFADQGSEGIEVYSGILHVPSSRDTFFQNQIGVCFDDLGDEGVRKNYGNQVNVMAEIIQNRYDSKIPYHYTHITTNLNMNEVEEHYGTRVRSRIREMFNVIELTGEDRRK